MLLIAYGCLLETVPSFKYLDSILLELNYGLPEVVHNLRKAQKKWEWLSQVLRREGVDAWMSGLFYVMVVQVVFLYGSETWVMYPHIGRGMGRSHPRVVHSLTGWHLRKSADGTLV